MPPLSTAGFLLLSLLLLHVYLPRGFAAPRPNYKHEVLDGIYGLSFKHVLHERHIKVDCTKPFGNVTLPNGKPLNTSAYDDNAEVSYTHFRRWFDSGFVWHERLRGSSSIYIFFLSTIICFVL